MGVTIRTPQKAAKLLEALRAHPSRAKACRKARISRNAFYMWLHDDPAFAAQVDAAIEEGLDALEDALTERATATSDTAAIFLLKTRRRAIYGEHVTVAGDPAAPLIASVIRYHEPEPPAESDA
jgi:hypothetical protein